MSKYSKYWDMKVKLIAEEVIKKATVDKEMIEYYVSGMIFAVEHDLADGREAGLMALNNLIQVSDVFTSESYFKEVHPNTPKEEIDRMKNLGKELKKLMDYLSENIQLPPVKTGGLL